MLEEWKNFIVYRQWCKDEDVTIVPHIIVLVLLGLAYLVYKLLEKRERG